MKIAIDMDEVIAHFLPAFIEFHNKTYQTNFKFSDFFSYEFWGILGETRERTIQKMYEFHKTDYFKNIKPIDESIEAIQKLKEKYELMIITSRQIEIETQTKEWIDTYFPQTFSEICFANHNAWNTKKTHSKSEICKEFHIPIIIEDSLEYAEECAHEGIQVYLFNQPWNQKKILHEKIKRVFSWTEILKDLV